jgi:hypothetical protein
VLRIPTRSHLLPTHAGLLHIRTILLGGAHPFFYKTGPSL